MWHSFLIGPTHNYLDNIELHVCGVDSILLERCKRNEEEKTISRSIIRRTNRGEDRDVSIIRFKFLRFYKWSLYYVNRLLEKM